MELPYSFYDDTVFHDTHIPHSLIIFLLMEIYFVSFFFSIAKMWQRTFYRHVGKQFCKLVSWRWDCWVSAICVLMDTARWFPWQAVPVYALTNVADVPVSTLPGPHVSLNISLWNVQIHIEVANVVQTLVVHKIGVTSKFFPQLPQKIASSLTVV